MKRFIDAQAGVYDTALKEIRAGRKTSHWIWYIFPQIQGMGYSYNSKYYAIKNLEEAEEYLQDETLGSRLREITSALLEVQGRSALDILGHIDAIKVKSCMTLFDFISPDDIFKQVLIKYFNDSYCRHTIKTLIKQMKVNDALDYIGADPTDFHLTDSMFFRSTLDSIHGIDHVYRTMIGCAMIGKLIQKPRAALLAFCGAYIHDLARATDWEENEHGANAALNYFDKFNKLWDKYGLTPTEREQVKEAVRQHSIRETTQKGEEGYDVMAILKDADALDRCRIGDLNPAYLRYPQSCHLVRFIEYIYSKTVDYYEDITFIDFINKIQKD